jgi:prepilin-type processing-associated H-X9-DG protein
VRQNCNVLFCDGQKETAGGYRRLVQQQIFKLHAA